MTKCIVQSSLANVNPNRSKTRPFAGYVTAKQIMKTLTQVVECKVITQHGGWNFTVNSKDIHYHFSWEAQKLITSRDDHAEWLFYRLFSNGYPGQIYAIKLDQGRLVEIKFSDWDPNGGFRRDEWMPTGGHNVMIPLSDEEHERAREYPQCVRTPSHEALLIRLITELPAK